MRWCCPSRTIQRAVVVLACILALSGSRRGVRTATTSSQSTQVPARVQIQKAGIAQSEQDKQRAGQVKLAFSKAFDDYLQFGFPADERSFIYSDLSSLQLICTDVIIIPQFDRSRKALVIPVMAGEITSINSQHMPRI